MITSQPAGALILIDGINYGTTPMIISLPTYIYGSKILTLEKTGYIKQSVIIHSSFQFIGLLNLICPPMFIVDAINGTVVNINNHDRYINIKLTNFATEDA